MEYLHDYDVVRCSFFYSGQAISDYQFPAPNTLSVYGATVPTPNTNPEIGYYEWSLPTDVSRMLERGRCLASVTSVWTGTFFNDRINWEEENINLYANFAQPYGLDSRSYTKPLKIWQGKSVKSKKNSYYTFVYVSATPAKTLKFPTTASSVSDFYDGMSVHVIGGPGIGETATILHYDGATQTAYLDTNLSGIGVDSVFEVEGNHQYYLDTSDQDNGNILNKHTFQTLAPIPSVLGFQFSSIEDSIGGRQRPVNFKSMELYGTAVDPITSRTYITIAQPQLPVSVSIDMAFVVPRIAKTTGVTAFM